MKSSDVMKSLYEQILKTPFAKDLTALLTSGGGEPACPYGVFDWGEMWGGHEAWPFVFRFHLYTPSQASIKRAEMVEALFQAFLEPVEVSLEGIPFHIHVWKGGASKSQTKSQVRLDSFEFKGMVLRKENL